MQGTVPPAKLPMGVVAPQPLLKKTKNPPYIQGRGESQTDLAMVLLHGSHSLSLAVNIWRILYISGWGLGG